MADNQIKLKKGEALIKEGDSSSCMYFLEKGVMAVMKKKGGKDILIGQIYSGELVGEMSFLDKEPRSATVVAQDECELTEIPSEKFEDLIKNLPPWYKALTKTLLARLRKANNLLKI